MTHVLTTRSLHHFRAISEATLLPEDAFNMGAPVLLAIPELPHSGDFSSAQDNHRNISSLISSFSYVMTIDHLWSSLSVTQPDFPPHLKRETPPAGQLWTKAGFSACNPNNQALIITLVTTNLRVQIMRLRESRPYHPPPCTLILSSINRPPLRRRGLLGESFYFS